MMFYKRRLQTSRSVQPANRFRWVLQVLVIAVLAWLAGASLVRAQSSRIEINSPMPGEAVQGVVEIQGHTQIDGFLSAELSFGYTNDLTGTWFLIDASSEPVSSGRLAVWDTNSITDGVYNLRLVVILQDGSEQVAVVPDLRVRNYTPVETSTPQPTADSGPVAAPTWPTATETPRPTPTPLPPNPAALTVQGVFSGLTLGAAYTAGAFLL